MNASVISFSEHLPASQNADKAQMVAAIQSFCMRRNFEDALSREEIGRLDKFDRVDAQRKSLLINVARYYRDNPKADVAVGVLTIITLLSDNDKGACTMSQTHIGLILSRSRTTISEAVTRLKASGLVESENGKSLAYPIIPRVVTQQYNHVVWVAEALKTVPTCRLHGTGQNLSASRDTCNTPVPQKRQVSSLTCPVVAAEPVGSTGHKFTKDNSTTLNRAASVVATGIAAAMASLPAAAQPPAQPPVISQPAHNMRDVSDKLFEAAGVAMRRGHASLEIMSTPRSWLDNGCDLEMDILPTIREMASRKPPHSISSWSFFGGAIADAKARRTAPMPAGNAASKPVYQDRQERQKQAQDSWLSRIVIPTSKPRPADEVV